MTYTHNARAVLPAASDCGAVGNANYKRAGWMSATDQISKSLAAGLDSDCGNGHDLWASSMNTSLASGAVPMALADTALTRLCATACLTFLVPPRRWMRERVYVWLAHQDHVPAADAAIGSRSSSGWGCSTSLRRSQPGQNLAQRLSTRRPTAKRSSLLRRRVLSCSSTRPKPCRSRRPPSKGSRSSARTCRIL